MNVHPIRFQVIDPVFNVRYLVQIGGVAQDHVDDYAKLLGVEPFEIKGISLRGNCFSWKDDDLCGIWIADRSGVTTLAHECFHAVHWMCDLRGMELCDESEEFYAYYLSWLMDEIIGQAGWKTFKTPTLKKYHYKPGKP